VRHFQLYAAILAAGLISTNALWSGDRLWLDVPFVRQARNGCGTACISMVLQYWEQAARATVIATPSEPEIRSSIPHRPVAGTLSEDMESYFKSRGMRTYVFEGNWADVSRQISKGRPLIVCLQTGRSMFHYVVVAGLDPSEDLLLVNDPARRKLLKWRRADFEKGWKGSGYWSLLALP
jgi:ABC-type bacteriocin/lantibiotic exporter with double-glycine peptidase domain